MIYLPLSLSIARDFLLHLIKFGIYINSTLYRNSNSIIVEFDKMKSTFKILAVLIAIIKNSELYVIDKYYITQNVPNDIKSIKLESTKLFDESSEKNQSTIENYKGMIVLKYLEGSTVELINESASLSISRLHIITGNVDENLLYYWYFISF